MMRSIAKSIVKSLPILILSFMITMKSNASSEKLTIYSSQKDYILKPLLDAYSEHSGVEVNFVYAQAGPLIQRLRAEGTRSPADIFMAVDAGNLWLAASNGLLESVKSETLESNIPAHLRDPENRWFGFSVRSRSIVYHPERVKSEEITTYESLAEPKWKGKLCLRTSDHVYNQSLVAVMIKQLGPNNAEEIVKGWVSNLAVNPFANDTQLLEAIAAGQCAVGITNHYYLARLKNQNSEFPVQVRWPNQDTTGAHVNVFGAGITKSSKNKEAAKDFLEWFSSDAGQSLIAQANFEFPAKSDIKPHELINSWGSFKHNETNLAEAGRLQAEAVKLMDRARYR